MNGSYEVRETPAKSAMASGGMAKRIVGAVFACAMLMAGCLLPEIQAGGVTLSHEGAVSLGCLLAAVALWACGTVPIGIAGLLCTVLLFVLGAVPTFGQAFSGYQTLNVWFILAIFCMTAIIQRSSLGLRLARQIVSVAGMNPKRLVLAFMIVSACISTIMTDAGAAVVTMGVALAVLDGVKATPGESNFGRCLLLGVTFAAAIGGFATPVSHPLNIVNSGLYESVTGQQVNFLEWACVGLPAAVVLVPVTWALLIRTFPPEDISSDVLRPVVNNAVSVGGWTLVDKKAMVFIVVLPVMWVASSFVSFLDPTVVTIIGLALMFVPGIDLLDWDYFCRCVNWNVFLMLGSIMCLGNAVAASGASSLLSWAFEATGVMTLNPIVALLIIAVIVYLAQTVLPVAPAFCTLLMPVLIPYAVSMGISPLVPTLVLSALLAGNFLLPLNPNNVITYGPGYYSFFDMARGGWKPASAQIALVVLLSIGVTSVFSMIF